MRAFLADFGDRYQYQLSAVLFVLVVASVFNLLRGILW